MESHKNASIFFSKIDLTDVRETIMTTTTVAATTTTVAATTTTTMTTTTSTTTGRVVFKLIKKLPRRMKPDDV